MVAESQLTVHQLGSIVVVVVCSLVLFEVIKMAVSQVGWLLSPLKYLPIAMCGLVTMCVFGLLLVTVAGAVFYNSASFGMLGSVTKAACAFAPVSIPFVCTQTPGASWWSTGREEEDAERAPPNSSRKRRARPKHAKATPRDDDAYADADDYEEHHDEAWVDAESRGSGRRKDARGSSARKKPSKPQREEKRPPKRAAAVTEQDPAENSDVLDPLLFDP